MLAKELIELINVQDREKLAALLSRMTALEFMVLVSAGYGFLVKDVIKLLEKTDESRTGDAPARGPDPNGVLHPLANTNGNEGDRAVPDSSGSSAVV